MDKLLEILQAKIERAGGEREQARVRSWRKEGYIEGMNEIIELVELRVKNDMRK